MSKYKPQRDPNGDMVCSSCGCIADGLVQSGSKFYCDSCDDMIHADDLDLDDFEDKRRQRIAEANEY